MDNIYIFSILVISTPATFLHDINTDFTNEELLVKLFTWNNRHELNWHAFKLSPKIFSVFHKEIFWQGQRHPSCYVFKTLLCAVYLKVSTCSGLSTKHWGKKEEFWKMRGKIKTISIKRKYFFSLTSHRNISILRKGRKVLIISLITYFTITLLILDI